MASTTSSFEETLSDDGTVLSLKSMPPLHTPTRLGAPRSRSTAPFPPPKRGVSASPSWEPSLLSTIPLVSSPPLLGLDDSAEESGRALAVESVFRVQQAERMEENARSALAEVAKEREGWRAEKKRLNAHINRLNKRINSYTGLASAIRRENVLIKRNEVLKARIRALENALGIGPDDPIDEINDHPIDHTSPRHRRRQYSDDGDYDDGDYGARRGEAEESRVQSMGREFGQTLLRLKAAFRTSFGGKEVDEVWESVAPEMVLQAPVGTLASLSPSSKLGEEAKSQIRNDVYSTTISKLNQLNSELVFERDQLCTANAELENELARVLDAQAKASPPKSGSTPKAVRSQLSQLEREVGSLQAENGRLLSALNERNTLLKALALKVKAGAEAEQQLRGQIRTLCDDLDEKKKESRNLVGANEDVVYDLARAEKELARTKAELQASKDAVASSSELVLLNGQLQAQVRRLEAQALRARNEADDERAVVDDLRARLRELKAERDDAVNAQRVAEQQAQSAAVRAVDEGEVRSLRSQLRHVEAERDDAVFAQERAEKRMARMEREQKPAQDHHQEVRALQMRVQAVEEERNAAVDAQREAEQRAQNAVAHSMSDDEVRSLRNQLRHMEAERDDAVYAQQRAEKRLARAQNPEEVRALRMRVHALEQERDAAVQAEQQVALLQATTDDEIRKLRHQLRHMEAERDDAMYASPPPQTMDEVRALRRQTQGQASRILTLEAALAKAEAGREPVLEQLAKTSLALEESAIRLRDATSELEAKDKQISHLQARLKTFVTRLLEVDHVREYARLASDTPTRTSPPPSSHTSHTLNRTSQTSNHTSTRDRAHARARARSSAPSTPSRYDDLLRRHQSHHLARSTDPLFHSFNA